MRKLCVSLLFGAIALSLTACVTFDPSESEPYQPYLGSWKVVNKPGDWLDSRYVFTQDGFIEIYWAGDNEGKPNIRGSISSLVNGSFYGKITRYHTNPIRVGSVMHIATSLNGDDTMKLGFYSDEGKVTWYLGLIKE